MGSMNFKMMIKLLLSCAVVLFSVTCWKAQGDEIIESKQKPEYWHGKKCIIESSKYRGICTVLTRTVGTDSTNLHFYLDNQRLVSFIIQNEMYQQEISSDGMSFVSRFIYVWENGERAVGMRGTCKESSSGVECLSDNKSVMAFISK